MDLRKLLGDPEGLAMAYRLFGRQQLKNALTGIYGNRNKLAVIAGRNKDDVKELIQKRDAAIDANLDYAEELANLDND
jgi:mannose/fructose-specific phosphotransferase system component IIA